MHSLVSTLQCIHLFSTCVVHFTHSKIHTRPLPSPQASHRPSEESATHRIAASFPNNAQESPLCEAAPRCSTEGREGSGPHPCRGLPPGTAGAPPSTACTMRPAERPERLPVRWPPWLRESPSRSSGRLVRVRMLHEPLYDRGRPGSPKWAESGRAHGLGRGRRGEAQYNGTRRRIPSELWPDFR